MCARSLTVIRPSGPTAIPVGRPSSSGVHTTRGESSGTINPGSDSGAVIVTSVVSPSLAEVLDTVAPPRASAQAKEKATASARSDGVRMWAPGGEDWISRLRG